MILVLKKISLNQIFEIEKKNKYWACSQVHKPHQKYDMQKEESD